MNSKIQAAIEDLQIEGRTAIVGLSGFSGSGKSTLARSIQSVLPQIALLESDIFWIPENNRLSEDWSSIDRASIRADVLIPAREGRDLSFRIWDWERECHVDLEMSLPGILMIEGIGIFHPDLSDFFDLKIWVDAPFEAAMASGMRRDGEEYGLDNEVEWREVWIPNEWAYFERFRPDLMAEIVVPWYGA